MPARQCQESTGQRDAVGDGKGGNGFQQHQEADKEHQADDKQHVVDAAHQMLNANHQIADGIGALAARVSTGSAGSTM